MLNDSFSPLNHLNESFTPLNVLNESFSPNDPFTTPEPPTTRSMRSKYPKDPLGLALTP